MAKKNTPKKPRDYKTLAEYRAYDHKDGEEIRVQAKSKKIFTVVRNDAHERGFPFLVHLNTLRRDQASVVLFLEAY